MPHRPLDLKRQLIARVIAFAFAVLALGTAVALLEMRYRVQGEIGRTGHIIRQLITDEIQRNAGPYHHLLEDIDFDLNSLQPIGELTHFCLQLDDLYGRQVANRCFGRPVVLLPAVEALMRQVIGPDARYQATVGQYPGVTVGHVTITPNYGSELAGLARNLANLLAVSLTILFFSFLIYRPVRAALAPTDTLLDTLKRMENGDLAARVPALPLIELDRIGQSINHLAERLQHTIGEQRRLAHRLLTAREEERLHLSRELHDEFGQYLTSLNAEASFVLELADETVPALRPCADSIRRTVDHMMEVLQQILHRLRPLGLDQFGLQTSLEQLIAQWNRRCRDTRFSLVIAGPVDGISDNAAVTLYRIVQESITNTVRHGAANRFAVDLSVANERIDLRIEDDGRGGDPGSEARRPGFGLLGMEERVLALGGQLNLQTIAPTGTRIAVSLPRHEPAGVPA